MKAEIETFQMTPGSSSEASSTLSHGYVLMSSLLTSWCCLGLISAGSGNGLRGFPPVAETVPPPKKGPEISPVRWAHLYWSGAHHFEYKEQGKQVKWISTRDSSINLLEKLDLELSSFI